MAQATDGASLTAAADQDSLDDDEFVKMWMMGMNTDRVVGRPKEWDGIESGFDAFAFEFSNWLAALPGKTEGVAGVRKHSRRRDRVDLRRTSTEGYGSGRRAGAEVHGRWQGTVHREVCCREVQWLRDVASLVGGVQTAERW